jgi:hypothetical protein
MTSKAIETLYTLMTDQLFIFAVAIVLFLLVITLAGPGKSEAMFPALWV